MSIDLADYERGRRYKGHYKRDLAALQQRLAHIQVAHIVHGRAAVVMLEGWDAAGKGGIIQRLTAEWDQRNYEVFPIAAPTPEELSHDFLWRFRTRLPEPGNIVVFDRSWYGRVLVERVEEYATRAEWKRSYAQIVRFEEKLVAAGTTLVKLFVHVSSKEQDERLAARLDDPWKRWKTGLDGFRNRAKRTDYLTAMHEMFERTGGAVPWHVIDGNDKKAARIDALTRVVEALEANVPMQPPLLDPEIEAVARAALAMR